MYTLLTLSKITVCCIEYKISTLLNDHKNEVIRIFNSAVHKNASSVYKCFFPSPFSYIILHYHDIYNYKISSPKHYTVLNNLAYNLMQIYTTLLYFSALRMI